MTGSRSQTADHTQTKNNLLIRQLNIEHFRMPANKPLAYCPLPSPLPREREQVSAVGKSLAGGQSDVRVLFYEQASVGAISFVKTKRNRTHGTRGRLKSLFQTA